VTDSNAESRSARPSLPEFSASTFANLLGVVPSVVTDWIHEGLPCTRVGRRGQLVRVRLEDALPWVIRRRETPGSQRERLAKAQADKTELENARRRGELVRTSDVADALARLAADLATRHDGVPGRVASELAGISDPAVIRGRLLDELRAVRGAFADATAQLADAIGAPEADGDDPPPASETKFKRVGRRKPGAAAGKRRARKVPQ